MRVAAIDVGSNSIHMIIAQVESDGRFRVLDRAKEMVRLGQRTLTKGRLSAEAMRAGVRTLAAFRTLAERHGVNRLKAVATSAVREAANGGEFIQQVQDEVGLRVKVIPGREEARLIHLGVSHAINLRGAPSLLMDAGGGSVEVILVHDGTPVELDSLKIGVSRLSEQFITGDPPTSKELQKLEAFVAEHLDPILRRAARLGVRRIIGTSGTLLSVITIAGHLSGHPPDGHLNNFTVTATAVRKVRRLVCKSDREARQRIDGLDAKRVELIIPGACIADYVANRLRAKEVIACTWALREGVLLDFIARHQKGIAEVERYPDVRHRSVARFTRHLGETEEHGAHVARLALRLFDQLKREHHLGDAEREWLEFAALMHDVGHHISHSNHQRHAYYLITNSELLGFQRDEVEIIAQVARYHRKGPPKDTDPEFSALPAEARTVVRTLGAILRVADALDRSHYGVVRNLNVTRRDKRLILQLHTGGEDAALEIWDARERARLLQQVVGLDVDFRTVK
jgi:exopolyphosphatase / guanosine-5'-triphosphate,3'-diphosphate pyrophosphatase